MRTTLDIPDTKYRKLKIKAAHEGTTLREIVLRSIDKELEAETPKPIGRLSKPPLKSHARESIRLNNEQIYDLIGFP
jgi:hypothetical protein